MRNIIPVKRKKIMIFCFVTFVMLSIFVLHPQQVTLYDSFGEPRVYYFQTLSDILLYDCA